MDGTKTDTTDISLYTPVLKLVMATLGYYQAGHSHGMVAGDGQTQLLGELINVLGAMCSYHDDKVSMAILQSMASRLMQGL